MIRDNILDILLDFGNDAGLTQDTNVQLFLRIGIIFVDVTVN